VAEVVEVPNKTLNPKVAEGMPAVQGAETGPVGCIAETGCEGAEGQHVDALAFGGEGPSGCK